jgi:hypothetical protein
MQGWSWAFVSLVSDSQIGIKEWKIPRQITERFSCISSFEAAHIMEMVFSTMRIIEEEHFVSRCFGKYTSLPSV